MRVLKKTLCFILVFVMCLTPALTSIGDSFGLSSEVKAAADVTEKQLYMLAPSYLQNDKMDNLLSSFVDYAGNASAEADANENTAKLMHDMTQGTGYLVSYILGETGLTQTEHEKFAESVAFQVVKDYMNNVSKDAKVIKDISDGISTITLRRQALRKHGLHMIRPVMLHIQTQKHGQRLMSGLQREHLQQKYRSRPYLSRAFIPFIRQCSM